MKINWKVRLKNPVWWTQVLGSVLLTALAYQQMQASQLTSWTALWSLLKNIPTNPYLLMLCLVSVWNAINDPTVSGMSDSLQALSYEAPKVSAPQSKVQPDGSK